jgi:hypothetical protein
MLGVIILSISMLSVIMVGGIILSVAKIVVTPCVVILNAIAPSEAT